MKDDLSAEQLSVIDKAQKLLNLAAKNPNAHEAAAAAAKANELLAKHNLDSAVLDSDPHAVKREKNQVDGGTYAFQRDLWAAVARLNFCAYWNQKYLTEEKVRQNVYEHGQYAGKKYVRVHRRRHAVIGRVVNTRATIAMASYLQGAIERLLTERLKEGDAQRHSNWAWSFRKGAADEIVFKLRERRREHERKEDQEIKRRMQAAAGAASGSALTIAAFSKSEEDANYDFRHGEGAAAERDAIRAERAAMEERMEAAYTAWAAKNPDKARSSFEYEEGGRTYHYARPSYGRGGGGRDNIDYSAYKAGSAAGKNVGLDPQAEGKKTPAGKLSGPGAMHL